MKASHGNSEIAFGTQHLYNAHSSMFSVCAHNFVFSLISTPPRPNCVDYPFLLSFFLSLEDSHYLGIQKQYKFFFRMIIHIDKERLGFVLNTAPCLSLPRLGSLGTLAFFNFFGNLFYGSAKFQKVSCKPLLATDTLLKCI